MRKRTRTFTASLLVLGGSALLSGCAGFDAVMHKQSTSTFEDAAAFLADAQAEVAWMPSDATEITLRTSTLQGAADAAILFSSAATLSDECTEVSRTSSPAWVLEGAPSPYEAETVWVCGEWSAIPTGDGWFGWAPNSDDERRAALG